MICFEKKIVLSVQKFLAISIGLAFGALALNANANPNLIVNGGFETGTLTPDWALTPGGPFDGVCANGFPAGAAICTTHSGTYAMTFGLNGAEDYLSQTFATTAGARYNLSFFLANDNPTGVPIEDFDVLWNGASIFSLASPQISFPYTEQAFSNLVATSGLTTLTFVARHDPSQWFLDDVAVEAVPEPASLALAGLGFLALSFVRRRRAS
jgi:hypothetical protein